jgi:hypothetical protein
MPLLSFITITVVVLGISIVGMYIREGDPTSAGEGGMTRLLIACGGAPLRRRRHLGRVERIERSEQEKGFKREGMKRHRSVQAAATLGMMILVVPMLCWAGGTVEGKVSFSGKLPAPKEFLFSKFPNPNFCVRNPNKDATGKIRLLHEVEVGKDGGLKHAVVAIEGINDEKFEADYRGEEVAAELCEFKPYITVVVPNQKSFRVMNHDADPNDPKSVKGVLHNPHAFEMLGASSSTIFNIGLPEKDKGLDKPIKLRKAAQGSVFRMQCDQHEFMQTWALPITNPYYAIAGDDGKFTIKNVPPGKYKLVAWHPALNHKKPIEQEIEVKDGAETTAKFEFKP